MQPPQQRREQPPELAPHQWPRPSEEDALELQAHLHLAVGRLAVFGRVGHEQLRVEVRLREGDHEVAAHVGHLLASLEELACLLHLPVAPQQLCGGFVAEAR
eukprot:4835371-Prymnesium_polylepis.1